MTPHIGIWFTFAEARPYQLWLDLITPIQILLCKSTDNGNWPANHIDLLD